MREEIAMGKTYGYIRCSGVTQDKDNQRHGILEYANTKNLGKVTFTVETVSGKKSWKERGIKKIIDHLQTGDVLIISELSRLGRSMMDIMEILAELLRKEVKVYAIKGNYELADNIQSKVIAFAFSIASEIERDLISQRTKEALARKKAEGVILGRPVGRTSASKLDGKEDQIRELLRHGVAKAAIARILGVSRITLLDFIKSRKLL
jgi:DNA invertase Pin-like site-specific DNA recombinase